MTTKKELLELDKEQIVEMYLELSDYNEFFKKSNDLLENIKKLIEEDCNDLNNHLVDSQREMIDALNKKLFKTIDQKRELSKELYDIKKSIK